MKLLYILFFQVYNWSTVELKDIMMSKYLLEVGCEELPYKFIPSAIQQLKNGFETFLNNNKVEFENVNVYATPRRLAVIISGLEKQSKDEEKIVWLLD